MAILKDFFFAFLDFFFPRYCLMCGRHLDTKEMPICIHCNMEIPRTFLWQEPYDNVLAKRLYGKADVEKVAAYVYYHSHSDTANIFYAFKYDNEPFAAVQIGETLAKEIVPSKFFEGIDCIIPVPLNKKKQRKRGYNQSERLAHGISKVTGIKVVTNSLTRKKNTTSQTLIDSFDRQDNMKGVFATTIHAQSLTGKHCMLIDDVITTGATISACARVLAKIPGIRISIFALGCVKDKK